MDATPTTNGTGPERPAGGRRQRWPALYMLGYFLAVGLLAWWLDGHLAQLAFFAFIGVATGVGFLVHAMAGPRRQPLGHKLSLALVGLSLFLGAGVFGRQSFQIEGFWFHLLAGVFGGVVVHYLVGFEWARTDGLWWFLGGCGLYYAAGIALAFALRDNRAFCKHLCPVAVLLRLGGRWSLLAVTGGRGRCTGCRACERACPMDVEILSMVRAGRRVQCPECTLCQTCIAACPRQNLGLSVGWRSTPGARPE